MIENKNEISKDLEKALQVLEQAKRRVANEKKKQNEKKRRAENHHKYIMRNCGRSVPRILPEYPEAGEALFDKSQSRKYSAHRKLREDIMGQCACRSREAGKRKRHRGGMYSNRAYFFERER